MFLNREQEKELLMRKKGKRPRGRPRKILVSIIHSRISFFDGLRTRYLIFAVKFRKMCPRLQSQAALHLAHHLDRPPIPHPRAPPLRRHQTTMTTMTTTATLHRQTQASEHETFILSLRRRRRLSLQNRSPQRNEAGNLCPLT